MQKIKLPFNVVQLRMENNPDMITTPVLDSDMLWVNLPAAMMAGKFANKYQDKILDKGDFISLLEYYIPGKFKKKSVRVKFKSGKYQIAFRELEVEFEYFIQEHEKGYWAIVPALGVETFTSEESQLEEMVCDSIRMDFIRKNRLNFLQDVISAIWYKNTDIYTEELIMRTYTPAEVLNLQEEKKKELLPQVAKVLIADKQYLFGYEKELDQLAEILKGKYNKNVLISGRTGVGKSTLVMELVHQQKRLKIKQKIWETTASTLIKELSGDVGWQENLSNLCTELRERGDILFIRNLLELFEVGQYEGNSVSLADYLREYIARGEITIITECTAEEQARIEARSPNYINNFQLIQLAEPKEAAVLENIILKKVQLIADSEQIIIEEEAIKETIRLNKRYTPYSGFPGKPIRFLESMLIGSKALKKEYEKQKKIYILNRKEVIKSFCEETGMPSFMVDPSIPMLTKKVEHFFKSNVFGQNHASGIIIDILASIKTSLQRQGKPIASMLFVGPTGVGKTEMAKVLSEFMFGSREKMIRFDMSEYSTPYAVARLTGENYFSDGLLTSALRREPFCVLLFDEMEKADSSFNDLLLQILGEGRLTDSQGKVVNFCSSIIIMTSNIGAKKLQTGNIGWTEDKTEEAEADYYVNEVRRFFRPEIFNRIDQIVPFYTLTKEVVRKVVEREVSLLRKREGLLHRNVEFKLSEKVYLHLGNKGYQPKYGARALQRTLKEELIIPLSYQLNKYSYDEQLIIEVDLKDDKLIIDVEADPLKLELMLEQLTQNEYMDFASLLRQNIFRLFEGSYFVRLQSELDILKRAKRRNSKKFWSDQKRSAKYSNFLALQEKLSLHRQSCEENETEMALISMGHSQLNSKIYDQMELWEIDYFRLKIELYGTLNKGSNNLYLGIYGKEPKRLLEIYIKICEEKGFEWTGRTVWYREELYNKLVDIDNAEGLNVKEKAKEYHKKVFDPDDKNRWKPEQKGDSIQGIELLITGVGADLYLKDESGTHSIVYEEKNRYKYQVESHISEQKTPSGIHRKNFLKLQNKSRRSFSLLHIEDSVYKLGKRELRPAEQVPYLIKVMDKLFVRKLDELLF